MNIFDVVVVAAACCYLAVREGDLELLDGLGSDVEAHPALGDGVHVHDLVVGVRGEFVRHTDIRGQVQLDALLGGNLLEFAGKLQLVILHEGSTHVHTTSLITVKVIFNRRRSELL